MKFNLRGGLGVNFVDNKGALTSATDAALWITHKNWATHRIFNAN